MNMSDSDRVTALLEMSAGAKFHAADLHVHTPASRDMAPKWRQETPDAVVQFALANDLSIIAVTDHNSADWCDQVAAAAMGTPLHVFPGVELSTKHGHLLAIFEKGTPASNIREFLVVAGFPAARQGDLDAASPEDMHKLAQMVDDRGGIAIAAHVESNNGLMKFTVNDERQRVYACHQLRAVEIGDPARRAVFQEGQRSGYSRRVACVMSSDCVAPGGSTHELDAIGSRFTMLKMDEVSIAGLRQALCDPQVRIRLPGDGDPQPAAVIEGLWVSGGFLDAQHLRFSDNLTCLIGATGSGKSLATELLRFGLGQQATIAKIAGEVASLLSSNFPGYGQVSVVIRKGDARYLVERAYDKSAAFDATVRRVDNGQLIDLDEPVDLPSFFPIKGYSQSEIIEFAREPEARLSLTDDLIDISTETTEMTRLKSKLRTNAGALLEVDGQIAQAAAAITEIGAIRADIARLRTVLNHARVKGHGKWQAEKRALAAANTTLVSLVDATNDDFPTLGNSLLPPLTDDTPNADLIKLVRELEAGVNASLVKTQKALVLDIGSTVTRLASIQAQWDGRFQAEETEYMELLRSIDADNRGLPAQGKKLTDLEGKEANLMALQESVTRELEPKRDALVTAREQLLTDLQKVRRAIFTKRDSKAKDLTAILDRRVTINVAQAANDAKFLKALDPLKVGSRISEDDTRKMAKELHPVPFVKSLLARDFAGLEKASGVRAAIFEKFFDNVVERNTLRDLYQLQVVDVDDTVEIRFKVSDTEYRDLEKLAHGQKCTVVLMVAMAEGGFPMIVDQPEDALHAPYIEGNIVAQLRTQRGHRQYIFATRNANVLVSGDAEQIIVMEGDASSGWVDRAGSIDRFTTRDLVLLHLEGGKDAFERKQLKYSLDVAPA